MTFIRSSIVLFFAITSALSFADERQISTVPDSDVKPSVRNSNRFSSEMVMSKNNIPTTVTLNNKGAYVARLKINYQTKENGKTSDHFYQTHFIPVGKLVSINIPKEAGRIQISAELKTMLIWEPYRTIFNYRACQFNNNYFAMNDSKQIIQFEVWGSTFHSNWTTVHPWESSYWLNTNNNNQSCW